MILNKLLACDETGRCHMPGGMTDKETKDMSEHIDKSIAQVWLGLIEAAHELRVVWQRRSTTVSMDEHARVGQQSMTHVDAPGSRPYGT